MNLLFIFSPRKPHKMCCLPNTNKLIFLNSDVVFWQEERDDLMSPFVYSM